MDEKKKDLVSDDSQSSEVRDLVDEIIGWTSDEHEILRDVESISNVFH